MSILLQIIQNCLSPNNSLRNNAEQEMLKCCDQNLLEVFSQLCNLIKEESTPDNICLFCGTFVKHIFSQDKYISIWNSFSTEQQTLIKNFLLGSLASEKNAIKKGCSLAIAGMAKIEIPKGWNIIEVLCKAAIHENINYKITALITIQNIIDFMGNKLKKHEKQQILGSLTTDLSTNEKLEVINEAIIGYYKIIPFIEENFKNGKERNFMINLLINLLEPNYINRVNLNEIIQKNILITLIYIAKYYTLYLQNDFTNIANMSFRYFNCNNKILSTTSIELWSTVLDTEIDLKNNMISSNFQDNLNDSILRVIQARDSLIINDEDEWTPTKASVILLSSLCCAGNIKIIERMLKFVAECLNSNLVNKFDKEKENMTKEEKVKALIIKENAFLIYRGILFSKDIDEDIIANSLERIIIELKDNSNIPIANSIALCLAVICKVHFNIINETQKKFDNFIVEIIKILEFHLNNKIILNSLCLSVKHILRNAYPKYFNNHLGNILSILIKIAYDKNSYNKDLNITETSMFFIGKLIEICQDTIENKKIIQIFFSDLYTRLQNSLNPNNFSGKDEQICYQNCLLSLIVSCGGEFQKIQMNETQITCVFNLIDQCLQKRGCLFEEAILALGSLSFYGWDLFSHINNNVMKYILFSLEERQDYQLCYQGLLAADDIIRSVGKENISIIPNIVEKIQKIINDSNIPRGLRIKCFALYSDIFMIDDKSNLAYLKEVLQLIVDGMSTSIKPPSKDMDEETLEYLNELREKVVELLTGVFMFLSTHNQTNIFSQYIDGFVKYLSKIVEPEFKCKLDLIFEICGLLGDLYKHFSGSVDLYLSPNSLKIIFDRLEESPNPDHKEILNYNKEIMNDLISNYMI